MWEKIPVRASASSMNRPPLSPRPFLECRFRAVGRPPGGEARAAPPLRLAGLPLPCMDEGSADLHLLGELARRLSLFNLLFELPEVFFGGFHLHGF